MERDLWRERLEGPLPPDTAGEEAVFAAEALAEGSSPIRFKASLGAQAMSTAFPSTWNFSCSLRWSARVACS